MNNAIYILWDKCALFLNKSVWQKKPTDRVKPGQNRTEKMFYEIYPMVLVHYFFFLVTRQYKLNKDEKNATCS